MILSALRSKLADRGPLGITRDAAELALGCGVVSVVASALAGGAIAGLVVAVPAAAYVRLTAPRGVRMQRPQLCADCWADGRRTGSCPNSDPECWGEYRSHACNADCASDQTPCGGGE